MTYKGHIENGQVVFDEPAALAEGTIVRIDVVGDGEFDSSTGTRTMSLADELGEFIGKAEGLPADWASEHDKYLRDEYSR